MSVNTQAIKNDPRYKAMRKRVLARDGHICKLCGSEKDLTVDHIIPLARGGDAFADDNGQVLCRSCNGRKQDKTVTRVDWCDPAWLRKV